MSDICETTGVRGCPSCGKLIKIRARLCKYCKARVEPAQDIEANLPTTANLAPVIVHRNVAENPENSEQNDFLELNADKNLTISDRNQNTVLEPSHRDRTKRSSGTTATAKMPSVSWQKALAAVIFVLFSIALFGYMRRYAGAEEAYKTASKFSKKSDLRVVDLAADPNADTYADGQLPAPGQSGFLGRPKTSFSIVGDDCAQTKEENCDEICANDLTTFQDYLIANTAKFQTHIDELIKNGKLFRLTSGTKVEVLKAYRWDDPQVQDFKSTIACEQVRVISGEQNGKICFAQWPQKVDPSWLDSLSVDERRRCAFAKAAWFLNKHSNEPLESCLKKFGLDIEDPLVKSLYNSYGDCGTNLSTVPKFLDSAMGGENQADIDPSSTPLPSRNNSTEEPSIASQGDGPPLAVASPSVDEADRTGKSNNEKSTDLRDRKIEDAITLEIKKASEQLSMTKGDEIEAKILNKVGLGELKSENYTDAADQFRRASEADPSDPKLLSNEGFAEMHAGMLDPALNHLLQSLAIAPDREVAWNDLAMVYARKGEHDKSLSCFSTAFKISGGRSIEFLNSLAKDEDPLVVQAAAAAVSKLDTGHGE